MGRSKLTRIVSRDVRGKRIPKKLTEARVRRRVTRILRENRLCSIATVSGRSRPHINTAYFCDSGELELYFLSHPGSLHCRNLEKRPSAGVTVFSSSQPWGRPRRGLQLFGTCRPAGAARARQAEKLCSKRFPAYGKWKATRRKDDPDGEYRFYRFVVRKVKLMDEESIGDGVFVCADVEVV